MAKTPKIVLEGIGTELELGRVASIDVTRNLIYLEQMSDGLWRLNYTKSLIPDVKRLTALSLVRDESDQPHPNDVLLLLHELLNEHKGLDLSDDEQRDTLALRLEEKLRAFTRAKFYTPDRQRAMKAFVLRQKNTNPPLYRTDHGGWSIPTVMIKLFHNEEEAKRAQVNLLIQDNLMAEVIGATLTIDEQTPVEE